MACRFTQQSHDLYTGDVQARSRGALFNKRLIPFSRAIAKVSDWDVDAVHRARVASRRLRELIPLLELRPDTQRVAGHDLRRVTRCLGKLREADVAAAMLDELRRRAGHATEVIDRVAAVIASEIAQSRSSLSDGLPASELEDLVRSLQRIARDIKAADAMSARLASKSSRAWLTAIEARVARRAARLAAAMASAGAIYAPDPLHAVRIALKKLRYAIELVGEATGQSQSSAIGTLKRTQDLLGRLHDLEEFSGRIRLVQAHADRERVREMDVILSRIGDECRQIHSRYMCDRPALAALTSRLSYSQSRASTLSRREAS